MPGADLVTNPVVTWTDNVDNWRASDADFLQKRANMRFTSVASRTTFLGATPPPGMVSYVASTDSLQFTDFAASSSNVWRTILAPTNMAVSDAVSSFGMRLASDGTAALALEAGKVVLGPARILTVDTAVRVKTGTATASLTTDATALVSDVQIKAPSATLTGALAAASISNTGAITTTSVVASGNVQAATLNISGTSTLGVVNSGNHTVTGTLTASAAITGSTSVQGGSILLTGTTVKHATLAGTVTLTADAVISGGQVVLNASSGPARYGSTSGPFLACSVASASDPGVGNYPEGTLWLQV